jgi:hypothetical protein
LRRDYGEGWEEDGGEARKQELCTNLRILVSFSKVGPIYVFHQLLLHLHTYDGRSKRGGGKGLGMKGKRKVQRGLAGTNLIGPSPVCLPEPFSFSCSSSHLYLMDHLYIWLSRPRGKRQSFKQAWLNLSLMPNSHTYHHAYIASRRTPKTRRYLVLPHSRIVCRQSALIHSYLQWLIEQVHLTCLRKSKDWEQWWWMGSVSFPPLSTTFPSLPL